MAVGRNAPVWLAIAAGVVATVAGCRSPSDATTATPVALTSDALPASASACDRLAPLVVTAADAHGTVAPSFIGDVTVEIVSGTGAPGAFLSGTRTVHAVGGVATFNDLSINVAGTGYRLNITAAALPPSVSAPFTLVSGVPAQLGFTAAPATGSPGITLATTRVTVRDACGSPAAGATNPVTLAFGNNAAAATLSGTLTVAAVNGVATFTDLIINKAGAAYTLAASSAGLASAVTTAFTVPGPP